MSAHSSESTRAQRAPRSIRWLRAGAAAFISLLVATCHSEPTASKVTATVLAFSVQPASVTAGTTLPAVRVEARDNAGNIDPNFNGSIAVAIETNPSSGTLLGTTTLTASGGAAVFTTLRILKSGTGYTLRATAGALSGSSAAFNITPGPASKLVFTGQPANAIAGASIPVTVTAQDSVGNTATSFSGGTNSVSVAIGTNPSSGVLTGTTLVTAVNGVAPFANLSINKVGTNYTLTATATNLTGATSAAFNVTPGTAEQLFFTTQPTAATSGVAINPAVVVTARDAQGNTATGFTGTVTLTLAGGTAGATLSGGSIAAVAGLATFPAVKVNKSGAGYTLTAAATGVATGATSTAFNIRPGTASQLAFVVQPILTTAGQSITPGVQVAAQDASGNTDTAFAGSVTLTITSATGTVGAHLAGGTATPVTAHTGIATFSALSIDSAGASYTLSAAATGGLTGGPSAAFNIKPGAATQLAFTVQPSAATAGTAISPAVKVTARDALGNTDTTFKTNITLTITAATGTVGAHLTGGTVTAASGVATFSALSIDSVGASYTLTAAGVGTPVTSAAFNIRPGGATKLAFLVQPANATAGATIPTVKVTAQDVLGNTDTTFNGNITMDIGANPGGGALGGTLIIPAVKGVATYADLTINKSGTGYKLQATSGALSPAASAAFNIIAGTATKLTFTVEPVNTQAGDNITPAVEVSGQDALGNTDLTYTGSVTVAIGTNPPTTGVLSGTKSVAAVAGVARFSNLSIDVVGNGYTLNATALGGLTGTTSATFNIIPNTVHHLVFTQGPTNATAGVAISPAIVVTAFDASNNVATQFTGGLTLAITAGTGTAGAHLSHQSSVTVNAVLGVATFSNLSVDSAGTGYKLDASGPATLTSGTFNITPAPAAVLVFTTQPGNRVAGVNNTLVVTARDSLGNRATSFGSLVTLGINSGPAGGTILSGGTATASSGVASFAALRNDKTGAYTLSASGGSVSTAVASASYNITPAAASVLDFTGQPSNTVAAATMSPAVQVTAHDPFGNIDTNYGNTHSVTLTLSTNPGGATLSGATQTALAGIITFPNVTLNKVANGYRLSASDGSISSAAPSNTFNITPAVATKLVFTVDPVTTTAGQTMAAVAVAAQDANGNIDTSYTGTITLAFANNPGGGGLGGTLIKVSPHGVGGGVVTFSDLSIDVAEMGYRFQATSGALAQGQSAAFSIVAAAATKLAFVVQPNTIVIAGGNLHSPTGVRVAAEDQFGNIDSSFTGTIGVTLAGPTSTLIGTTSVAAVTGVASFPTLRIHLAGISYTLSANFTGLVGSTSAQFDVRAAPADHLVFTTSPSNATAGAVISPNVVVAARDTFNNLDSGFVSSVTLSINSGPAGVLKNASVTPANGLATFTSFNVETAGAARTLVANGGGLTTPVPSGAFTISAAAATHLTFTTQPANATAGVNIPVVVAAQDQFGNTDPAFTGAGNNVTLSENTGPGGVLNNTLATPVNGVATFGTFNIETAGTYTLSAAGGSLVTSPLASSSFTITAAAADHLVFTQSPALGPTVAGDPLTTVTVVARDQFNNRDLSFTNAVTVSIDNNPGSGTLRGTVTHNAASGLATFTGLNIDKTGTGYTLKATDGSINSSPSSGAFNIIGGTATHLVFTTLTDPVTNGVDFPVVVQAQDSLGNADPSYTAVVTLTFASSPAISLLSGTVSVNAVAGVASLLPNIVTSAAPNSTFQFQAASGALPSVLSATFTVNP